MPRWLPAALYVALTAALFREFLVTDRLLFGTDILALGYFARKFYAEAVTAHGTFPFWNPYLFGGLPFVDAMHGEIFYPVTLLNFVLPVHRAIGWHVVLHVAAAGGFAYLWLRRLGASGGAALWGGAAYLLGPFLVSLAYPGHSGKIFVTALTPLFFWAADRAVSDRRAGAYAGLAVVVALLVLTAHVQLAYFAVWGGLAWVLYRLFGRWGPIAILPGLAAFALARWALGGLAGVALFAAAAAATLAAIATGTPALRERCLRFAAFAGAGVLGVGIGAVQLWGPACYLGGAPRALCGDTYAYSQRVAKTTGAEEERGYAYSTSWSMHPEELVSLVVPEFVGASLAGTGGEDTYWGRNPFRLNHVYAGLLGLLLAPLVFLRRRAPGGDGQGGGEGARGDPRRGPALFFVGLAAVALLYALGATTPVFRLFYVLVPGVRLFRAPDSIMFLFGLAVVTLGAFGIDALREGRDDPVFRRRLARYGIGAVAGLGLAALLASAGRALPDLWVATVYRGIPPEKWAALEANLPRMRQGFWIAWAVAAATFGLAWAYVRARVPAAWLLAGLVALTTVDEARVGGRFIHTVPLAAAFPDDEVFAYLREERDRRTDPFRVFSVRADDNSGPLHGLEEVRGHHGNEIGRYRDLVEGPRLVAQDLRLLRMLNAEYVLSPTPVQAPGLEPVGRGRRWVLYRLQGAFPRAYLVGRVEVWPDEAAPDRLVAPDFDPARTAVLPAPPEGLALDPDVTGTVRWLERELNRARLEVEATGPALLVVSETYYPAWRARVDEAEVPVLRANHALRAVPVPAGRHEVELRFESAVFRWSLRTSLACAALALLLFAGDALRGRRAGRARREGRAT